MFVSDPDRHSSAEGEGARRYDRGSGGLVPLCFQGLLGLVAFAMLAFSQLDREQQVTPAAPDRADAVRVVPSRSDPGITYYIVDSIQQANMVQAKQDEADRMRLQVGEPPSGVRLVVVVANDEASWRNAHKDYTELDARRRALGLSAVLLVDVASARAADVTDSASKSRDAQLQPDPSGCYYSVCY